MRLRQVALVARELGPAVDGLTSVLGLQVSFNDPGVKRFGLENAVMPVGDTFLEVVAPVEAGTTAGRLLDKRGGDGGYMVILQVDDIAAARARVAALGVRVADSSDRDGAWSTDLHPKDVGGAILSLDAMDPAEKWDWAGPGWREHVDTSVSTGITGVEVQGPDPQAMANRWGEVLGIAPYRASGTLTIQLDGARIRFVRDRDGRGEGVAGFDVAVHDPEAMIAAARARGAATDGDVVTLCGTRVRLVAAEPSVETVVAEMIRDYSDMFGRALHANNASLMRPYCHVPAMHLGPTGVRLTTSLEEHDASWSRAHEALRPQNYGYSVLHTVDVRMLNSGTAAVDVDCSRYTGDGAEFMHFPASYMVTNTPDGWKICSWVGRSG